jgi:hypothetical protein
VDFFTGATFDNYDHLQKARVWGCPVYVLDPRLEDGSKIPKWDPRSRRGMFVGMYQAHSSSVGRILNIRTGNVSSQFHVVYDDLFSTATNGETGGIVEQMKFNPNSWLQILETGCEKFADPIDEASSGTSLVPSLYRELLSNDELPPSATIDDPDPYPRSQPIRTPVLLLLNHLLLPSTNRNHNQLLAQWERHLPQREILETAQILRLFKNQNRRRNLCLLASIGTKTSPRSEQGSLSRSMYNTPKNVKCPSTQECEIEGLR